LPFVSVPAFPPLNSPGEVVRQLCGTHEEHIAVLQKAPVVVVIRVVDLPKDAPAPVGFEEDSGPEWGLPDECIVRDLSDVDKSASFGEISVVTGIRHEPGVDGLPIEVDQMDRSVTEH